MLMSLLYNVQASLHSGVDLRSAVRLPPEETFNDWVAIHGESSVAHVTSCELSLLP